MNLQPMSCIKLKDVACLILPYAHTEITCRPGTSPNPQVGCAPMHMRMYICSSNAIRVIIISTCFYMMDWGGGNASGPKESGSN